MSTSKGVVVKINEEPYLTTYKCGETIDGLLNRLNQNFKVSPNDHRLYILSKQLEEEEKIAPLPDQNNISIKFFEDFDSSRHPWLSSLFNEMDTLILHLRPTIKSLMARKVVLEYIKKNLSKCLGARVFCIGSSMNNIFLPNETIEVTPFLCKGQEDKWFLRVNEGLCASAMANGGLDENVHIKSITFNCENASILVNINQLSVNVCHNELVSLYSGALLEDLNHNFGRKSLIKKSLLFIKSWCCYDSNQYSAAGKSLFPDLLSAKVLHILVLHIFCRYGTLISHPIVALSIFLYYYSNIEWNSVIINVESSLSAVDMNPLTDLDLFPNNSPLEGMENTNSDEIQQIKSLITNYRLRYQSTIWASTRAKEEDTSELSNDPIPRDSSISERESEDRFSGDPITFKNFIKGAPAWGISSACPSLTNEFQLPQGLLESEIFETYDGKKKGIIDAPSFNVSHMNISDSIRPSVNLTAHLTLADVEHITSILSSGYDRLSTVFKRCAKNSSEQLDEIDLGMNMKMDLTSYFISETIGMSRDVANIQKVSAYSPDDAANIDELKSSKFFCESEGPESVMRHAELIMGSKITADAVAHLIAHIVEQAGPHPIGEIGKLLQEATGNPNLSRVLKSQFRGLKKLIEGYPHMLRLGGDHSFNPHVYLADKSSSSNNSEVCVDSSLEAMTDRDSDDPISPPGSLSQTTKKQPITQQQSPLNYQTNNRVLNIPQDNYQYYASVSNSQINNNNNNSNNNVNVNINVNGTMNNNIINNNNNNSNNSTNNNTKGQQILSQHYQSQLQQYRPSSSISPWQIQDNNRNALYNTNTTTNSNNTNSNININANSNNNNSNNNNNNISSPSSSNTNISGVTHQSRNGIGVSRLHVDAGEYDPHRGTIEYYTQNNIKSRSDNYMGVEMNPVNRNSIQQIQQQQSLTQSSSMNGNTLAHQYASYRKSSQSQQQQQQSQQQLQQQQQQYDQYLYQSSGSGRSTILPSRSQNLNTYQTISRNQQMMRSPLNQGTNSRYDMISENSYLDITNRQNSINNSNRLNYNNSNSGSNINVNINNSNNNNLQTWERNSLGQYDTDLSYQSNSYNSNNNINNNNSGSSSSSNLQTIRQNPSNIVDARSSLGLSYDIDYSRSSRSMPLSNGRLQQTDNLDLSLEFETADRQSFLLPSDYDLASQSYSISDYDILKDAVYANTNQSISMNLIGHEYEENNTNILMGNRQYPDGDIISSSNTSRLDGRESFYGDSKMLPYFLRESER